LTSYKSGGILKTEKMNTLFIASKQFWRKLDTQGHIRLSLLWYGENAQRIWLTGVGSQ